MVYEFDECIKWIIDTSIHRTEANDVNVQFRLDVQLEWNQPILQLTMSRMNVSGDEAERAI